MKYLKKFEYFITGDEPDLSNPNAYFKENNITNLVDFFKNISEGARYPYQIQVFNSDVKNEQKVGNYGIGVDIDNEYSKLIDGAKGGKVDLGVVGKVPEATLYNIKQTYKDATIKIVDDHYILTRK